MAAAPWTMTPAELARVVEGCIHAVVATRAPDGQPEAAVVGIVVTDALEVFFDTSTASRKMRNLRADPRVAVVIGWDDEWTVQLDGLADEPSGDDLARLKALYFARFPDGREREKWPDIGYLRVRPTWGRLSDFRGGAAKLTDLRLDPP